MDIDFYEQIKEIENAKPQSLISKPESNAFELIPDEWLVCNLSGNYGALFIRAILFWLNIDEYGVLRWRLENKYKQYKVLCYYYPGCVPETFGLSSFLNERDGIEKIKTLFLHGYFLKATLGDASYSTKSWDKSAQFDEIMQEPDICSGQYEKYMIQKKLQIKSEFRIHSFCKEIIPCLTYLISGDMRYRSGAEEFLKGVLLLLPDQISEGTLIGWDVALTHDDGYFIIEANFTGYHSEYRKGFQTTGYVDNHYYGSIICAWLNTYFRKYFGVYADSVGEALFADFPFYRSFIYYLSIFKVQHFDLVQNKAKTLPLTLVLYLGEDSNVLIVNLIRHFLLVDFASRYIVIVRDKYINKVSKLFSNNFRIQLCTESWLFTKEQFEVIKVMGYERRKIFSCYHAARLGTNCTIL